LQTLKNTRLCLQLQTELAVCMGLAKIDKDCKHAYKRMWLAGKYAVKRIYQDLQDRRDAHLFEAKQPLTMLPPRSGSTAVELQLLLLQDSSDIF